jgi:hypothetical protein
MVKEEKEKLKQKLLTKTLITEKGCWLWLGASGNSGYGNIRVDKIYYNLHRYSHHLFNGFNLDSDLQVRHKCATKSCWNPEHLIEGTQSDNEGDKKIRGNRFDERTHCSKGHEFTNENTGKLGGNHRYCKKCRSLSNRNNYLERQRKYQERKNNAKG